MKRCAMVLVGLVAWVGAVEAAVKTETVDYPHESAVLEGYLAYDDATQEPRPGILVVHEWKGLGDYAKHRAEQLAQLGYLAFAVDMYGKGVRAKDHDEAAHLSAVYRDNRQLMRGRILAALDVLKQHPLADPERIAAIGYCFGGTTVLELARSGADILGVVSFHGGLDTPTPAQPGVVKAKVLVLSGADDRFVSPGVPAFEQEMQGAGVDYRIIQYPGAVHSFTVPESGNDPSKGMAYNAEADRESWEEMQNFFSTLFGHSELRNVGEDSRTPAQEPSG
jgi:dienelactone hydrolase